MADVFRQGRKSVHRAIVSGDPDDPFSPAQCNLDPGGSWGISRPLGNQCVVCFAGMVGQGENKPGPGNTRRRPFLAASALGAAGLALWLWLSASGQGLPVTAYASPSYSASGFVVPSPTPSGAAPSDPPQTPAPTHLTPTPSPSSDRQMPPIVVIERVVVIRETVGPEPTRPRPTPAPTLCPHPGLHLGFTDCRWPHAG